MSVKKKIAIVMGTRPEAIKLAPLTMALKEYSSSSRFEVVLISTGQHQAMLEQVLQHFRLECDFRLNVMTENQSVSSIVAESLKTLPNLLQQISPELVIVQGDTASAFAASFAAFSSKIPVAHIEAGLRTGDLEQPFPEEGMRQLIDRISSFHFAATEANKQSLLAEGISSDSIFVTGNTGIDALLETLNTATACPAESPGLRGFIQHSGPKILLTAHRRENLGQPLTEICEAALDLVKRTPELKILFPVHLNPKVQFSVHKYLANQAAIILEQPLSYPDICRSLAAADFILTDSGGLQEEAPSLGKPVLVLRDKTERQEGIEAGCAKLVGSSRERILEASLELLNNSSSYKAMSAAVNPYGDGRASQRIAEELAQN